MMSFLTHKTVILGTQETLFLIFKQDKKWFSNENLHSNQIFIDTIYLNLQKIISILGF
jgi:hypothetical protein